MSICYCGQSEWVCPHSDNYEKGQQLAEVLRHHLVSLGSLAQVVNQHAGRDVCPRLEKEDIAFNSEHVRFANAMVKAGLWERMVDFVWEATLMREPQDGC